MFVNTLSFRFLDSQKCIDTTKRHFGIMRYQHINGIR